MKIIKLEKIDSTNKYLKENFDSFEDFTVVQTAFQTAGKGRNERKWLSNDGENLLFSILLKNQEIVSDFKRISLICACTIRKYLEKIGFKNVTVKWPNDVFVGDKKIAGILLEGSLPNYLVVGIGVNVNQTIFDGDYRVTPTSMMLENKKKYDINEVFEWVLDDLYQNITSKKSPIDDFRGHNYLINKLIDVEVDGELISGKVLDINEDCSLKIDTEKGIKNISSNEINTK